MTVVVRFLRVRHGHFRANDEGTSADNAKYLERCATIYNPLNCCSYLSNHLARFTSSPGGGSGQRHGTVTLTRERREEAARPMLIMRRLLQRSKRDRLRLGSSSSVSAATRRKIYMPVELNRCDSRHGRIQKSICTRSTLPARGLISISVVS